MTTIKNLNDLPNRYGKLDTSDNDEELDKLMEMSEEESEEYLDRELKKAKREYDEWWKSLTLTEQVNHLRRGTLRSCINNRNMMLAFPKLENEEKGMYELSLGYLRSNQKRLLKIRIFRTTGVYPSEA